MRHLIKKAMGVVLTPYAPDSVANLTLNVRVGCQPSYVGCQLTIESNRSGGSRRSGWLPFTRPIKSRLCTRIKLSILYVRCWNCVSTMILRPRLRLNYTPRQLVQRTLRWFILFRGRVDQTVYNAAHVAEVSWKPNKYVDNHA